MTRVSDSAVANQATKFTVTVSNTGAAALTLDQLNIFPASPSSVSTIGQPQFLTPQVALGDGEPTINAAGSVSYGFQVVFTAPSTPGPSPDAPGPLGIAGMVLGQPANAQHRLIAQCRTSDGATAQSFLSVPVLSAVEMFPTPTGGAAVFSQGADANLIAAII